MKSDIIGDEPCPSCRAKGRDSSGNHLILFANGNKYCNRCGYKVTVNTNEDEVIDTMNIADISKLPYGSTRGISVDTAKHFGVRVECSPTNGEPVAEYYPVTKNGKVTGYKVRQYPKIFKSIGDAKNAEFFGQHTIGKVGKRIIVTEGELDAMSAYQMLKEQYPTGEPNVISLPSGANAKAIDDNYEFLNNYREIVVCTDMDDKGREVASEFVGAFGSKVRIMELPLKDANEMLQRNMQGRFVDEYLQAKEFIPDGVICGSDISFDDIWKSTVIGYSLPYPILSSRIGGLRKGELTTVTAGSGIGKSTLAKEIAYHLLNVHKLRIGIIALEEPLAKTIMSYVALDLNVPVGRLRQDTSIVSRKDAEDAFERLVHNDNFWAVDHFGSMTSDSLMEKMRYLGVVKKCDFIILDHLSLVISGMKTTDERKEIDMLQTNLATFVTETGVGVISIVHLKRSGGTSFNEGGTVSLNDLRGSAALEQLSFNVIALERDQQDEESKNYSNIRVLKCREHGYTGLADRCLYNVYTGRHSPANDVPDEEF